MDYHTFAFNAIKLDFARADKLFPCYSKLIVNTFFNVQYLTI